MIGFNVPPLLGTEFEYVKKAISNHKICGDGEFTKKCSALLEKKLDAKRVLLTTSCSSALEMSALLCCINPGDEVIMPSFTFVSTANAFVLRGAKIVFVDIRPDTMNLNENLIEDAITDRTKAIVPVHYAGVGCEMDKICEIAKKHNIKVVEDAAQGVMSEYNGRPLGTIGDIGCFSFHETKNYSMGEGGAIILNDENYIERSEILREKGTNRSKFFRGQVDKYTWVDMGSSYLPSEINAAYLYAQLIDSQKIYDNRMNTWNNYHNDLAELEKRGYIKRQYIPENCKHNAHMYYIKTSSLDERTKLIDFLKQKGIQAVFHYVPLHSSPAGLEFGRFNGEDKYTTSQSECIIRLPMYYDLKNEDREYITDSVKGFYTGVISK